MYDKDRWKPKEEKNTYIILYQTPEEGVWEDNIFTTDSEKEFNDFLDYLKTERVENENFYLSVTNIRTIVSKNNTQYNQLYHRKGFGRL